MNEPVLMHPDIDERTKVCDIRDRAFWFHTGFQMRAVKTLGFYAALITASREGIHRANNGGRYEIRRCIPSCQD